MDLAFWYRTDPELQLASWLDNSLFLFNRDADFSFSVMS